MYIKEQNQAAPLFPELKTIQILNISINNQDIYWENSFSIVEDSKEYLYCKFNYNSDWDDATKQIRFYNSPEEKYYAIDTSQELIKIPPEVIHGKQFYIAVGGYNDEGLFIPTSALKIPLKPNGFGDIDEGVLETDPSPDTLTGLLMDAAARCQEITILTEEAEGKRQSDFPNFVPIIGQNNHWFIYNLEKQEYQDTGVFAYGVSAYEEAVKNGFIGTEEEWLNSLIGYTPIRGIDYYTEQDKAELVVAVLDALPAAEEGGF
jgi:hypothetical protein